MLRSRYGPKVLVWPSLAPDVSLAGKEWVCCRKLRIANCELLVVGGSDEDGAAHSLMESGVEFCLSVRFHQMSKVKGCCAYMR